MSRRRLAPGSICCRMRPVVVLDAQADVRRHDAAAVGDGAVGDRHLERVGLQVALAHGQVDVVARAPGPVGEVAAEQAVAPLGRRHQAGALAGKVDPGRAAEPEAVGPLLDHLAALLVRHQADAIEEHVRGDLQRARQRDRAVRHVPGVLEGHAADRQRAAVEQHGRRADQPALEPRDRGDQLEGGTGRVQALGRAVGERGAVVGILQALVDGGRDALREDVRVVARIAAEPDHLTAARVHRDEAARLPVARERRLAGLLHAEVDRQAQPLAGARVAHRQLTLRKAASRPPGSGWRRCARAGSGRIGARCRTGPTRSPSATPE